MRNVRNWDRLESLDEVFLFFMFEMFRCVQLLFLNVQWRGTVTKIRRELHRRGKSWDAQISWIEFDFGFEAKAVILKWSQFSKCTHNPMKLALCIVCKYRKRDHDDNSKHLMIITLKVKIYFYCYCTETLEHVLVSAWAGESIKRRGKKKILYRANIVRDSWGVNAVKYSPNSIEEWSYIR